MHQCGLTISNLPLDGPRGFSGNEAELFGLGVLFECLKTGFSRCGRTGFNFDFAQREPSLELIADEADPRSFAQGSLKALRSLSDLV